MEVRTHLTTASAFADLESSGWSLPQIRPTVAWWDSLAWGLGHRPYVLVSSCRESGMSGCLPLFLVKSWMFGSFLVSLPYLNSAGVILRGSPAEDSQAVRETQRCLIDRAVELADALDVKHLELRGERRMDHPAFNMERTDKVHMRLQLPKSADLLMASYKSKLRSQVKKSGENPFEVRFGGSEFLENFYSVFSQNMRDLGTPVYSKGLFRCVVDSFGKSSGGARAEFCIVSLEKQPVSVALLVHHRGITEVPSASTLRRWNSTGANMWMYWNLLQRGIEKGSSEFDFGRSSVGSGTYKFKEQWGAKPQQAIWQYYVRKGDPSDMRPDSPSKSRLVEVWKKLPLWLSRLLGPSIVRGIP